MIAITNLGRDFTRGTDTITALDGISLSVAEGEFVAITGPSGSGKSTLLGLMAGLDRPTRGHIVVDGTEITRLKENELSRLRGRKMGFIFQNFQLIPTLTAIENVRVPAEIASDARAAQRARAVLEAVGLSHRLHHYPAQLSGGEMQRVAIARASITQPKILFADEPTGNLDSTNGKRVLDMLLDLRKRCTLILVTHNADLAALADREVCLHDGRIARIVRNRRPGRTARRAARL